jgi:hypothetical protein
VGFDPVHGQSVLFLKDTFTLSTRKLAKHFELGPTLSHHDLFVPVRIDQLEQWHEIGLCAFLTQINGVRRAVVDSEPESGRHCLGSTVGRVYVADSDNVLHAHKLNYPLELEEACRPR